MLSPRSRKVAPGLSLEIASREEQQRVPPPSDLNNRNWRVFPMNNTNIINLTKNNLSEVHHTKEIHTPLRWFGGKYYLAQEIISRIPAHHCFIEPFSGSGQVITQKTKSKVEVINDIDNDLINFLMVLRNQKDELIEALSTLPTSRFLTELWMREPMPEESFERAVRFYYILRQTIVPANNIKSGWRSGKIKNTAFDYQNAVARLDAFEGRLRNVMIECLDFREIIKRYDSPESYFYIDPPYVGRESYYKGGFSESDHIELAEMLRTIKGKALVSYYPDPLIDSLYSDWRIEKTDALVGAGVCKAERGQKKKKETELFIMNYEEDGTKIPFGSRNLGYSEQQIQLELF